METQGNGTADYFCGNEYVMVRKAPAGYGPGSVVKVDADQDGDYEYQTRVGADGLWCLTFEFKPRGSNEQGLPLARLSILMERADGGGCSQPISFDAVQESPVSRAKSIPVNCAAEPGDPLEGEPDYPVEPGICTCHSCDDEGILGGASLEAFGHSLTPQSHGVEIASGKYRTRFPITRFDTRMLGFDLALHYASMVKYDGPVGQGFSHGFNMMIVQWDDLRGQIVTPDLRVFDIWSGDGVNWHLPDGFNARLCRDDIGNRWLLSHFSGLDVSFYLAREGCPGYPVSICDPNGNITCLSYSASGQLREITTDLGQVQRFEYDGNGYLSSFSDHIGRTWRFPHDGEGRLTGVETPVTRYAKVPAGGEVSDENLDDLVAEERRCWQFSYGDPRYPNQISAQCDPRGAVYRENVYDLRGRVSAARINRGEVNFSYDGVELPAGLPRLEAGNLVRAITDREGNVSLQELHGGSGGPVNGQGRFGLRRSLTVTERGRGNQPLREGEPDYWERRWLQDCDCLNPRVISQSFSSEDAAAARFDEQGIPCDLPREIFSYNRFHQKTAWTYTDGRESISRRWTYQRAAFGEQGQFSRPLTETDPREFDQLSLYAGLNLVHRYHYDDRGNRTVREAPTVSLGTPHPQKIVWHWQYNGYGQPLLAVDPNGNITRYAYYEGDSSGGDINSRGRAGGYLKSVTRGAAGSSDAVTGLTRKFRVNALGMITRERDAMGLAYDTCYNDLQETVREVQPAVTLRNGEQVRYETRTVYDGAGNAVMVRRSNVDLEGRLQANPWIDQSASFDSVNNQLTKRVEVDGNPENDLCTRFAYDRNDDLIVTQKPEGNRSFSVFDERRLLYKTFYGVAPVSGATTGPEASADAAAGYPVDKRVTALDTRFVGLVVDDYDARGNRWRSIDGRGNFEYHYFDFYNRQFAFADPNGNGWQREFDDASNALSESRGAVEPATGRISEPLERRYRRFDEAGRQYQEVLDIEPASDEQALVNPDNGANSSYRVAFDPGSRPLRRSDANGNTTTMIYDAADRLTVLTDALGNQLRNRYDRNSNIIAITEVELPGPGATGEPEHYRSTFRYDELNRQVERRERGLIDDSIDHRWRFAYDSRNNQVLVCDAEGRVTLAAFDDSDRQVGLRRFDRDPQAGPATELQQYSWVYDRNSNIIEEGALADVGDRDSLQITRHAYDDLDRLLRTVFPDSDDPVDGSGAGADGQADRIELRYDENANPVRVMDQRGVVFASAFDPGNRLIEQQITLPPDVPGTRRQEFAYDSLNRTVSARNDYARVDQRFDALSRVVGETQTIRLDGSGFSRGWEEPVEIQNRYDRQSNRLRYQLLCEDVRDLEVTTGFDPLNRTASIVADYFGTGSHMIAGYSYQGPRRLQRKRLGNGAELHCGYDAKRRLQTHYWRGSSNVLAGFDYRYDRVDNALSESFVHDQGRFDHVSYDGLDQVVGVSYRVPGSVPPTAPTNAFSYDANFNRSQALFGGPFDPEPTTRDDYRINPANELAELQRNGLDTPLASDRAGNPVKLLLRPALASVESEQTPASARWDAFNLLFDLESTAGGTRQAYRYDPLRRRIASLEVADSQLKAGSRRFIYDGWRVLAERVFDPGTTPGNAASTLERIYVNGAAIDEPLLAAIDSDGDGYIGAGQPIEARPIEARPIEARPIEARPIEARPVEARPVEARPVEARPVEARPGEARPGELQTGPDGSGNRPVGGDLEYYYLDNRLGSIMALLDASDADRVLEYYRYSIFGEATVIPAGGAERDACNDSPFDLADNIADGGVASASQFGNPYLFTGRRLDLSTGLYYYRNRYYQADTGRFISRDFAGYADGMNLYAYVQNNPANWQDPLGLTASKADCVECRLAVVYSGSLGTSRKARYYTDSSAVPLPAYIDRRYWGLLEEKLERISLQARVKTSAAPCCCTASARGTITHTKELPDLSDASFDPGNGLREALKEYDPLAEPNLTDELLGKLTSRYKESKALHKLVLGSIVFALKRSKFVNAGSRKLSCNWRTVASVLDAGRVPTTRTARAELVVDGRTVCDIARTFKRYESSWRL